MIKFLKGEHLDRYKQLITAYPQEYATAFFIDTTNHKLYRNGVAIDSKISVVNEYIDGIMHKKFSFVNDEGETIIVSETSIPNVSKILDTQTNEYTHRIELRDFQTMTNNTNGGGFMSIEDKFKLDSIASMLGVVIDYEYYATVATPGTDIVKDYDVFYDADRDMWFYNTSNGLVAVLDKNAVHVKAIAIKQSSKESTLSLKFNGGTNSKTLETLTKHGNLPKGFTIEDMEKLTIDELLMKILFETAEPIKVGDQSCSLTFKNTPYTNSYVLVGTPYPQATDFNTSWNSETWQWTSADGSVKGPVVSISKLDKCTICYNAANSNAGGIDMTSPTYTGNPKTTQLGTNGYFYASFDYVDGDAPQDSLKQTTNKDGNLYCTPKHGTVRTETKTFVGAYHIYSNASKITSYSLWSEKNTQPDSFKGTDVIADSKLFSHQGATFYAKWPSQTVDNDIFYVYIPYAQSISSIGGAHDTISDNFTAKASATQVGTVSITNSMGVSANYKKYVISKAAGITTVKITLT